MDRKYRAVSPEEVQQLDQHLTKEQKLRLKSTFEKYKKVFDGTLGKHPTAKIDIQLVPNAKPIYQQPYPVSFKRKPLFNWELNNMIKDGVFTKIGESEWGFPSFIILKKDGRVRWLSDFQKLNELIVQKPFVLMMLAEPTGRGEIPMDTNAWCSLQQNKSHHHLRCNECLPSLFNTIQHLHWCLQLPAQSSNHSTLQTNCLWQQEVKCCTKKLYQNRKGIVTNSDYPQTVLQEAYGIQNHCLHQPQKPQLQNIFCSENPQMATFCWSIWL